MSSAHPDGTTLRHGFASQGNAYASCQFTSQRNETALGLYFYNARWYDPALGRFTRADTLVPAGAQGYDRYAYADNNPVKYVDPSGHDPWYCETATCERKYSNRFSTQTVDVPLRESDEGSSILEVSDILEDEADAIRNSFPIEAANNIINTAIGFVAGIGCGTESPICGIVMGSASNAAGSGMEDLIKSPTAEAYDDVAEILEEAANDEDTIYKDAIQVHLTPLAATGSLVSVDEYGYQTLNPDFHEKEYALTVEGTSSSVILTPSQAGYINILFGGGLLP